MAEKSRNRRKKTQTIRVNTTGGAVRITQPSTNRGKALPLETATVIVEAVTPRAVGGFFDFLREHAVIGLAIGVVIGTQLKVIVDSLNNNFINQLFKLLLNGDALSAKKVTVHWRGQAADLGWGAVLYTVIDFIFIMAVVYALIKLLKLDKLDKKPEDKK